MSDLSPRIVSSAGGAVFQTPDCTIADSGPMGMVTIRGDLTAAAFKKAIRSVTGVDVPAVRRFEESNAGDGIGWMSPDELLLVCAYEDAPAKVTALQDALAKQHALVVNVSDARSVFRIDGLGARELIAKGAPVDLSPDAFGPGDLRRSRLGQVAAAFWIGGDGGLTLVSFRSVGGYVFDWLCASAQHGERPGVF